MPALRVEKVIEEAFYVRIVRRGGGRPSLHGQAAFVRLVRNGETPQTLTPAVEIQKSEVRR